MLFREEQVGYLAGVPRRALREARRRPGRELGRRLQGAAGRPLHRRLPGGREGRHSRGQDAQRLLVRLGRPGEVQGARAEPDRAAARTSSSRSRAAAGSARSTRRGSGRSGGSASTPTSRSSGRTSSRARRSASTRPSSGRSRSVQSTGLEGRRERRRSASPRTASGSASSPRGAAGRGPEGLEDVEREIVAGEIQIPTEPG